MRWIHERSCPESDRLRTQSQAVYVMCNCDYSRCLTVLPFRFMGRLSRPGFVSKREDRLLPCTRLGKLVFLHTQSLLPPRLPQQMSSAWLYGQRRGHISKVCVRLNRLSRSMLCTNSSPPVVFKCTFTTLKVAVRRIVVLPIAFNFFERVATCPYSVWLT